MPLDYNGMWLQFFHTQRRLPSGASWVVGALLMQKEPPFPDCSRIQAPDTGRKRAVFSWFTILQTECDYSIRSDNEWRDVPRFYRYQ